MYEHDCSRILPEPINNNFTLKVSLFQNHYTNKNKLKENVQKYSRIIHEFWLKGTYEKNITNEN